MKLSLLLALTGAAPALAALLTEFHTVERTPVLPPGWTSHPYNPPSPTEPFPLSISIRNDEAHASLRRRLEAMYDPQSPSYRRFFSRDEVAALRAPPQERVDAVLGWLVDNGLDGVVEGDWVRVENVTVGEARELLGADVGWYSFGGGKPVLRAREYGVPEGIRDAVGFVHPVSNFMTPDTTPETSYENTRRSTESQLRRPKRQVPDEPLNPDEDEEATPAPCSDRTTPDCLRALYNISYTIPPEDDPDTSPVLYAVAGFLEQWVYHPDTHAFMDKYAPQIPESRRNITIELLNGGEDPQSMSRAGHEASLDVQYALSLSYPADIVYYSTGGRGVKLDGDGVPMPLNRTDNEPFLEFTEDLLARNDEDLPHVIAVSYADDEQGVPKEYALKVCDLFGLLTGRGVSIIIATGDGGARGVRTYGSCRSNDGLYRETTMASFPATCPYVTAIGAVNQVSPPQVATFSTGGFSMYFDRPSFQDHVVSKYIDVLGGHLEGHYVQGGRAIPDISALGVGFQIEYGGGPGGAMGTSASVPVFASMVALVNDARIRRGLGRTGWLNPRLYEGRSMEEGGFVEDVVGGTSASCVWENGDAPGGWSALAGWDAGTGLGVVGDFMRFLDAFLED